MGSIISNNPVHTELYLDHFLCPSLSVSDKAQIHASFFRFLCLSSASLANSYEKEKTALQKSVEAAAQSHQTWYYKS